MCSHDRVPTHARIYREGTAEHAQRLSGIDALRQRCGLPPLDQMERHNLRVMTHQDFEEICDGLLEQRERLVAQFGEDLGERRGARRAKGTEAGR